MSRFPGAPALLLFAALLSSCAQRPPLTSFSAGQLAARLANERCQALYGRRPFSPEDYEAVLRGGRWEWGGEKVTAVDGFLPEVTFGPDGGKKDVEVTRNGDEE